MLLIFLCVLQFLEFLTGFMTALPGILIVTSYFYPGFKAGGPPKSIYNLINSLGEDFFFSVITRDRDVDDTVPFKSIKASSWNSLNKSRVYYAKPSEFSSFNIFLMLFKFKTDLLYLNSFFGYKHSIIPFAFFFLFGRGCSCLIAPRGEFSPGALALKSFKKRIYISFFNIFLRNCPDLYWHATNFHEKQLILNALRVCPSRIFVAPNLPALKACDAIGSPNYSSREFLDIVFISRITPMKNLDFLIRCLRLSSKKIRLTVYGPVRDSSYWEECQISASKLPPNIDFSYRSSLPPDEISSEFSKYHLFVFPTLGENYGHIIVEALSSSVPVLVSDQTPWRATTAGGLSVQRGFDEKQWIEAIEKYCDYSPEKWVELRSDSLSEWCKIVKSSDSLYASQLMFSRCMGD